MRKRRIGTAKFFTLLLLLYHTSAKLNGFTPYGIDGTIYAFAKNDLLLSTMADAVAQSIAHADYLEHRAVGSGE